ncbi:MAG TPA: SDR family oxidoreductase [Verrucomicrobiae bacterium]|nr:SDR family oxidoreductase [Verrucomicrobiae bacterium]
MFNLTNKIALVTGAGSGIGASIAESFAQAGAFAIVADINEEAGKSVAQKIQKAGGKAEFIALDVSKESACENVAKKVFQSHGHLDVLVNNAGIGCVGTLLQSSVADLDRLYAVNVRGVFNVSKVFLPGMIERKNGAIINMASIGGVVGIRDRVAYCTTKFAVVGLTKSMALDHSHLGVRVNCICPGRVETPFVKARLAEYADPEKAYREMSGTQLTGRMLRPDEIAGAAVYLASDESASVTGACFMIDGGWSAGK